MFTRSFVATIALFSILWGAISPALSKKYEVSGYFSLFKKGAGLWPTDSVEQIYKNFPGSSNKRKSMKLPIYGEYEEGDFSLNLFDKRTADQKFELKLDMHLYDTFFFGSGNDKTVIKPRQPNWLEIMHDSLTYERKRINRSGSESIVSVFKHIVSFDVSKTKLSRREDQSGLDKIDLNGVFNYDDRQSSGKGVARGRFVLKLKEIADSNSDDSNDDNSQIDTRFQFSSKHGLSIFDGPFVEFSLVNNSNFDMVSSVHEKITDKKKEYLEIMRKESHPSTTELRTLIVDDEYFGQTKNYVFGLHSGPVYNADFLFPNQVPLSISFESPTQSHLGGVELAPKVINAYSRTRSSSYTGGQYIDLQMIFYPAVDNTNKTSDYDVMVAYEDSLGATTLPEGLGSWSSNDSDSGVRYISHTLSSENNYRDEPGKYSQIKSGAIKKVIYYIARHRKNSFEESKRGRTNYLTSNDYLTKSSKVIYDFSNNTNSPSVQIINHPNVANIASLPGSPSLTVPTISSLIKYSSSIKMQIFADIDLSREYLQVYRSLDGGAFQLMDMIPYHEGSGVFSFTDFDYGSSTTVIYKVKTHDAVSGNSSAFSEEIGAELSI